MQLLAHPFRLLPNGRAATVEQDSDSSNAQLLAVLLLTRLDERPLQPGFGTTDPTFTGLDLAEVAAAVTAYGPDITLGDVTLEDSTPGAQLIQIQFT